MSKTLVLIKNTKDRKKLLQSLQESGVHIQEDSGDRVLTIDAPHSKEALLKKLPSGSKLATPQTAKLTKPSETEKLLLDSLKLQQSKSYTDQRKKRKPGTTPEEKEQFTTADTDSV